MSSCLSCKFFNNKIDKYIYCSIYSQIFTLYEKRKCDTYQKKDNKKRKKR